jgi:hypothetical protein
MDLAGYRTGSLSWMRNSLLLHVKLAIPPCCDRLPRHDLCVYGCVYVCVYVRVCVRAGVVLVGCCRQPINLQRLENCEVRLLDHSETVQVDVVKNCKIFIGRALGRRGPGFGGCLLCPRAPACCACAL